MGEGAQVSPAERDFTEPLFTGLGALKAVIPQAWLSTLLWKPWLVSAPQCRGPTKRSGTCRSPGWWAKLWVQLLAIRSLVPASSLNHLAKSKRFCFQQEQDISHVLSYHFKGNLLPSPVFCTEDSDAAQM